jgi:acetyl-CoA carboxylase biotin carboxyl carrier protein
MALSFKEVADILQIIDSSECEEVTIEVEGTRIVVRRGDAAASPAEPSAPVMTRDSDSALTKPTVARSTKIASDDTLNFVHSPMVGTFYRCPAPGEAPFVEVGAAVKKGDPLCLIEVMKLYTTIEAPANGDIAAVHVEDNTLVEFDQILFAIK